MSVLRKEPITGRWVIFIEERRRARRHFPHQYQEPHKEKECPFCEGKEHLTPPEILAFRDNKTKPNTPGWSLRVVPDKSPILKVEGELDSEGIGMYDTMKGLGAHEIVIESNIHNASFDIMSVKMIKDIFWAYQQRIADLTKDIRLKYILITKN
ncbi:MAG: galactose-1-phosphate uridylyltransferase, partial [Candidatus Helarchaeota archaeon]|nr:galactose-1-phosphate uridylyltransferase [Candidatus Helarchaeota archaeon]